MRASHVIFATGVALVCVCGQAVAARNPAKIGVQERIGALNMAANLAPVSLDAEIQSLFSAAPTACGITGKAKEKLESSNSVPAEMKVDLKAELALSVQKIEATYVRPFLFQVFKDRELYEITGASAYKSIDPFSMMDGNRNNYMYTVDCSGYLTSALSAKVGLKIADAEAAASAATQKQWSMLIARARLWSPIVHAISPDSAPIKDRQISVQRLDTLWAIHSKFKADPDSAKIDVPAYMDILWTSKNGSASFQGKMDMADSINIGFAAGGIAGRIDAGASLSRASRFSSFVVYPLPSSDSAPIFTETLGNIRDQIRMFVGQSAGVTNTENSNFLVMLPLPDNVCAADLKWRLVDSRNATLPGIVSKLGSESVCKFTISPDPSIPESLQQLQKATFGFLTTAEMVGPAPLRVQVSLVVR